MTATTGPCNSNSRFAATDDDEGVPFACAGLPLLHMHRLNDLEHFVYFSECGLGRWFESKLSGDLVDFYLDLSFEYSES